MMLRPMEDTDAEALFELFKDYIGEGWIDFPMTSLDRFKSFISEILASEWLGFAIARVILEPSEQKIAGMILLTNIDADQQTAEMGTWLGQRYRGCGLNRPAKEEVMQYAFAQLNLTKILLVTAEQNIASCKAIAKLPYACKTGEEYNALKKHYAFLHRQAMIIYEITRDTFFTLE